MWYDVGLISSVALGGWLAMDIAMAEHWRRRSISLGLMGAMGALWAAAELMLRAAEEPWEFALCRRLLYLGVCGATFCWYWVAVEADAPRWFRNGRWRVALVLLPLVPVYSCLYWAPDGLVISLYTRQPAHGPLWIVIAVTCWGLIAAGMCHYIRPALRLRRESQRRLLALAAGVLTPLFLNIAYAAGWIATDPAPCLLGLAALLIRFAVIDTGLALYLPLARSDIIEQLAVGVVVVGIDDRVIDANVSAQNLLATDDLQGRRLGPLTDALDPRVEVLRFPLESHFSQTGTAVVLTDRSEAVEADQRLQLAGRLESIGSLTAGIAHEVNNPLAYICANLNFLEKLVADLNDPAVQAGFSDDLQRLTRDAAESLSDVQEGFERISMLVARLKGFARAPDPTDSDAPVDVHATVTRSAFMASVGLPEGAIQIRGASPRPLAASEQAVSQILVNLMLNAVQASGDQPEVEVEIRDGEDEIEIQVADRGQGLDAEALDRIFDPFYTTKRSGSGLGLSISFDLARRLGGRIEASNRSGGGAAFSLFLPTSPKALGS